MALEPVKIPQNVYVEDRIIGPVTLRQLAIVGIGCGISYGIWTVLTNAGFTSIVTTIMAWTPAVIFAAFAFLKINDISLFRMVLLAIERSSKPGLRTWKSFPGISINIVTKPEKEVVDPNAPKIIHATSRLTQLAAQLEEEQKKLVEEAQALQTHMPAPVPSPQTPSIRSTTQSAPQLESDEQEVTVSLPIDASRITAEALHPHFRIDGISTDPPIRHSSF